MKIPNEYKNHFIGKICTIFTVPLNRDFQQENPNKYPEQLYKYFVGVVEDITDYGILIQQAVTGLRSWIFLAHVISIAEEVVEYIKKEDVQIMDKPAKSIQSSALKAEFPNEFPEFDSKNPHANIDAIKAVADLLKKHSQQSSEKTQ
jgi:hypothetical protein